MADIDIPFGSGDTAPTIRRTLRDGSGDPVDLTGATVKFLYSKVVTTDEVAAQMSIDCTVVADVPAGIAPTDGVVDFTWNGEVAPRGEDVRFTGQYRAVLQGGKVMHFPSARPLLNVVVAGEP